jgi:hypothetical protein
LVGQEKPTAGIAAALPPWPSEKSPATRYFLIFRHALTSPKSTKNEKHRMKKEKTNRGILYKR